MSLRLDSSQSYTIDVRDFIYRFVFFILGATVNVIQNFEFNIQVKEGGTAAIGQGASMQNIRYGYMLIRRQTSSLTWKHGWRSG
jgi:hypothetical protein